jgi:ER lumen protein retaining receptor
VSPWLCLWRACFRARARTRTRTLARRQVLLLLKLIVRDHDNLFVLAEVAHFSGIGFLLYKLSHVESCEGARPRCAQAPPPRARARAPRP